MVVYTHLMTDRPQPPNIDILTALASSTMRQCEDEHDYLYALCGLLDNLAVECPIDYDKPLIRLNYEFAIYLINRQALWLGFLWCHLEPKRLEHIYRLPIMDPGYYHQANHSAPGPILVPRCTPVLVISCEILQPHKAIQ